MGRASRWFSRLFPRKKDSKTQKETASTSGYENTKDKKRWSFAKRRQAESMGHSPLSALEDAWLRSLCDDSEEESKHAIAVAVATAAAANAAVTAAQAAMVRLKSLGRERAILLYGSYERWAAVKIQTAFRCFLARKALRALKGLVKLQALVRGYLVRKQAAITLRRLQALVRAQSVARSKPARVLPQEAEFCHRRSFERFTMRDRSCKHEHSYGCDRSPKIVEMDTFQLKSKSFRRASSTYHSALEEPMIPISSPLPYKVPSQLSIPSYLNSQDYDYSRNPDKFPSSNTAQSTQDYDYRRNPDKFPTSNTAQSTPRLRPETPVRSVSQSSFPSYMANTWSFAAKVRPQSAQKQRPEKTSPMKKLTADGIEFSTGLRGKETARSTLQAHVAYGLKNRMVGKVDRSAAKVAREAASDYYFDSMW